MATSELDLSVGLKTLPLLTTKPTNPVAMAVVYEAGNPVSKNDAEAIKAAVDAGLEIPGNIKVTAQLVSTAELGRLNGFKIAFLAQALSSTVFSSIHAAASKDGLLTISTDLQCVKSGKCVLGIVARPRVEIYYSPAAAQDAGIDFAPAFIMLAKQV
jgi:hypothetical protein